MGLGVADSESAPGWTEAERLAALRRSGMLDTPNEAAFDDLALLAAQLCESPVALVSLVGSVRQWFKARVGTNLTGTPIEHSICRHTIMQSDLFVVSDLAGDVRFCENGLVKGEPYFRFYAGARLDTPDGLPLGTLCVMDYAPRSGGLSADKGRILKALAEATMRQIELRMANNALITSEKQTRRLVDAVPQFIWSANRDGSVDFANRPFREFMGLDEGCGPYKNWSDIMHPDDRASAAAAWSRCVVEGAPYETEARVRNRAGDYRWMLIRAKPVVDADGRVERWFGASTDIHEKKVVDQRLRLSEERYRLAAAATNDLVWDADLTTGEIIWGASMKRHFGYGSGVVEHRRRWWLDRLHPEDRARTEASLCDLLAGDADRWTCEYRFRRADGGYAEVLDRAFVLRDENGVATRLVGAMQDLTPHQKSVAAIRSSEERLRLALVSSRMVAWELNTATGAINRSENAADLLGVEPGAPVGAFRGGIPPEDAHQVDRLVQDAEAGVSTTIEVRYNAPGGRKMWLAIRSEKAGPDRIIGMTFDISDRKAAEEEVWRAAYHDPLTGLPNRALFQKQLEAALVEAEADESRVALFVIDLDGFKDVNASIGNAAGDALLVDTASRLIAIVGERGQVARIGGDEFAVIVRDAPSVSDAHAFAEEVSARLRAVCEFAGRVVSTRASIGVAAFPEHHREVAELIKDANIALDHAKNKGRNEVCIFTPEAREATEQRIRLREEVRDALACEEFAPFYQPKTSLETGNIVGLEALARWLHPTRGVLTPAYFGAAFDDPETTTGIAAAMRRRVATDMREWLESGLSFGRVAINLASAEFADETLADRVLAIFEARGVPPTCLEVEVTETVFLGPSARNVPAALRQLHEAGVTIALDDFGTGYASLSHLKQFPVDHIKIDRSFVCDLATNEGDAAIVGAVIGLGRSLGMTVTAEGVETRRQEEILRRLGCDHAQGYLYAKPLAASRIPWLLRHWRDQIRDELGWDADATARESVAGARVALGRG